MMQIRIEKLVYGGAGLARTDQGIVFVERVVPGELVAVEIVERKKGFARARLIEVLEAAETRIPPPCPNFEAVGCCDWAHIGHSEQVRIKESILRESLGRLGQIEWERRVGTIASPPEEYRMRATFHVAESRPGFVREGSHQVVPISQCRALMPSLNRFLGEAASALGEGRYPGAETIRAVASPTTGEVAATFIRGREKAHWRAGNLVAEVAGLRFRLRPAAFFQPNRHTLEPLQSRVVQLAGASPLVLELFSGDAFFSLALAGKADRVVAVDRRSTANAERNAALNHIENVTFVKASARSFLSDTGIRPGAVVLDPPRSGAGPNLTHKAAGLGASRIVYVSCNPTTLAADARVLIEHAYRLTSLEIVDQFPNTHHIETIALFEK